MAGIAIREGITIPDHEIVERFVRASGAGGQNVNKVATAVELRFDVARSPSLPEPVRARLLARRDRRMTDAGVLVIQAQRFRTQERNRQDARERLQAFIDSGLRAPKPRIATRPSRAARERRLVDKRQRSTIKQSPAGATGTEAGAGPRRGRSMSTSKDVVPPLPASAPRVAPSPLARWIGRSVLRLGGWRVVGEFPDQPKMVVIAAPHSSNWDGIWGFAAKLALGLEIRVLGKAQLFRWPLGPLLRRLGVIPIDRSAPQGTVGQAVELIRRSERIWYTLAPEGTRKRVERWKTGFWKIAHDAQVPILPAYFHYPDKVIGLGPPFRTSGDMDADLAALRQWYRPWQGRHRGTT